MLHSVPLLPLDQYGTCFAMLNALAEQSEEERGGRKEGRREGERKGRKRSGEDERLHVFNSFLPLYDFLSPS